MTRQDKRNHKSEDTRLPQKNRTRHALIAAAEQMMRSGARPTVSDVAESAGISRATAYRYFPTQEMLLAEVALFSAGGPLLALTPDDGPASDAVARLVRQVGQWAFDNEQPLRTLLRLSLDPASGVQRPGHRREWIAQVLAPVRASMDPDTYAKLSTALTLVIGIDPVVALTDIAKASRAEALDVLEWTARALVEMAMERQPGSVSRKKPRRTRA